MPLTTGSTLLGCTCEVEGLFSWGLQLVSSWIRFPTCCRYWGVRGGGHLSLIHVSTWERGLPCSPILRPSGPTCPRPCKLNGLYSAAQVRYRTPSPECFSWGGAALLWTALSSLPSSGSRRKSWHLAAAQGQGVYTSLSSLPLPLQICLSRGSREQWGDQ